MKMLPNSELVLLSQSWVDICGKPEKNSSDVEIKIAALDTRQCQLLANKTWKSMTTIQKLLTSENQLMAICPQNKTNSQPDRIGDSSSFNKPKSVLEVYSRRCAICHGDAFAIHDQAKLKETPSSVPQRSQYDEIVRRIKTSNVNERMPKGMDLDEAERQILLSAFL